MLCPVCGNEIDTGTQICPWCEAALKSKSGSPKKEKIRCRNIKTDQPTAQIAINRLIAFLHGAKADGVRVLKIIHGYGSTGKGGELRYALREYLDSQKYSPLIKFYVTGEEFGSAYASGREIARAFPVLKKDNDWNHHNKGITLIVLP